VVTLPLDLGIVFTSPMATATEFGVKAPDAEPEKLFMIKGVVYAAGRPSKPIAGATVLVKELNMTAVSNENGEYILSRVFPGKYTFAVMIDGKKQKETKVTVPDRKYDIEV
jgi:hypothetical protein